MPQEDTHSLECLGAETWQLEERAQKLSWAGLFRMLWGHLWVQGRHVPDYSQQKAELNAAEWLGLGFNTGEEIMWGQKQLSGDEKGQYNLF